MHDTTLLADLEADERAKRIRTPQVEKRAISRSARKARREDAEALRKRGLSTAVTVRHA